jgi:hypothetical protein
MKYIISEKQLAKLILQQQEEDLEYDNVDDANPENDDFVIGQEVDEQDAMVGGADENPAYPEVPKWGEHDTQTPTRGPANTTF